MILGLFLITFLGGCSSQAKLHELPTSEDMQMHIDLQNGKYDIDLDSEEKTGKKAVLRNNDDDEYTDCSDEDSEECDECDCDACATSNKDSCCEQTCDNCNAPKESVMYVPFPYPVFLPNNIGWQDIKLLTISPDENSTETTTPFSPHNCPAGIARCTARNHRSLSRREQENIENYATNDKIPENYRSADEEWHPDSAPELLPTRRVDQSVFNRKKKEQEQDFDLEEAKRQIEMLQREYAKLDQNEPSQQKNSYRDGSYHLQPNREVPYRRKEPEEYYQYVPKHQQNYKDDSNYPIPYQDGPNHQRSYQEQGAYEDVPTHKRSYQEQNTYEDVPNHEKTYQAQSPYQDVPNRRKYYQDHSTYQETNHQKPYQDKSAYQDLPNHPSQHQGQQSPYQGQLSPYQEVPINQKAYQDKHPYEDVPNHQKSYQDQRPHQDIPAPHFHQESDLDGPRHSTTNKNGVCNEQHPHIPDHEKQAVHNQPHYKYEATQDQPYQSVNELLKALTGRRRK